MENQKTFYRVVPKELGFGRRTFTDLSKAQKHIQNYKDGLPDNEHISDKNRKYWKDYGKTLKLYEVEEKSTQII